MKILNLTQGSPEWVAHRFAHFNASELAAAMGVSKKLTRSELLFMKATGGEREFSKYVREVILASGHRAEAHARTQVEAEIGEDLYPVIGVSDEDPRLSVSFDGITIDESLAFECKVWNEQLVAQVRAGELSEKDFPDHIWQMEQALLISQNTTEIIFTVAKEDGSDKVSMRYRSVPERRARIIPAWNQFEKDRDVYVHEEPAPVVVAAPIMDLPAVNVNIEGALQVLSNLPEFGDRLRTFIDGLNPAPESDQDFADAENEVKVLRRAEDELQAAEDRALAQISVVDEMRKMKAMLHKLARDTRLARERLVKDRKEFVRAQIQSNAVAQIREHIKATDARLGGTYLPAIPHDIAGSMKGKKSIASLREAAAGAVAAWKIEADRVAGIIEKNLETLDATREHHFLFNDKHALVVKDPEAVAAIVCQRIAQHEAAQKRQAEEAAEREREKIRAEERTKAEAEAKAREAAEREEREKAERAEPEQASAPSPVRAWAEPIEAAEADAARERPPADPVQKFLDSKGMKGAARKNAEALLREFINFTQPAAA